MISFLEEVAEHLISNYSKSLSDLTIVLPNRRASLFLRKHLAEQLKKNHWSPKIQSIEDFVTSFSPMGSLDNISLLFELYEVHRSIEVDSPQEFDEFIKWGQVLLHDFNEIDTHLVDANKLYTYLGDVKSIAHWNLDNQSLTEFQQNYITFFESLYSYYDEFQKRLAIKNMTYQGAQFRYVANHRSELFNELKTKKIIFAGLNALTKAEEEIIFHLEDEGSAEILWDVDDYYLKQSKSGVFNEAGFFIRKYKQRYSNDDFKWVGNHFKEEHKEINIYGIPKLVGQAKFCGQLIEKNASILDSKFKSAVILADENLLFPVLNSIPNAKQINVTMGLPISSTPLYDFVDQWINLQIQAEQIGQYHKHTELQYHRDDILKLCNHPVLQELAFEQDFFRKLSKISKHYFSQNEIHELLEEFQSLHILKLLFNKWEFDTSKTVDDILVFLDSYKNILIENQIEDQKAIEIEYVYEFVLVFNRIKKYILQYQSISTTKAFYSIFKQISKSTQIALYGEPLKGLQLMGVLESRGLDFEHLVLLSVNENTLPSSGKQNSFIPFDIKNEFKLPTYREKNAIFAYHFYRLLQRSKNVHLMYNTQADILGGGDKSRFIQQIIQELPQYNPSVKINEHLVASPLNINNAIKISIQKTEAVIGQILKKSESGFSPSSLNTYIKCPLAFYFKEIAKVKELGNNDDIIDSATFGTIVHESLYELYSKYTSQEINPEVLKLIIKNAESVVVKCLNSRIDSNSLKQGKNLLIKNVIIEFVVGFLKLELKNFKTNPNHHIRILELEERYYRSLSLNSKGKSLTVNFKGTIDRIDETNQYLRIIDYKTGRVLPNEIQLKHWEDLTIDRKFDKCFQLLMYAWLVYPKLKTHQEIKAGILSFKKLSQGFMNLKLPENSPINLVSLDEFEKHLVLIVKEILDQTKNFEQTSDLKACEYCVYASICKRN